MTNKVLAVDTASLAFMPSLYNPKTGITLESGQRMLFLLVLQDSYSQYPLFLFHCYDPAMLVRTR